MMKNRALLGLSTVLFLFAPVWAAKALPPIPPEVKTHMLTFIEKMTLHTEAFFQAADKADTPDSMAQAIETYQKDVRPLFEGVLKLKAKHAAFFAAADTSEDKTTGDPDLDKANQNFEKHMEKLGLSMGKAVQWIDNPKIKAALDKMQATMSLLEENQKKEVE